MKKVLFLLIVFLSNAIIAQSIDSLLVEARKIDDDSVKIRKFNKLAFSAIFNDTKKALEILNEGDSLANASSFQFGLTELTNTRGIYFDVIGSVDSARYYFSKALDLSRQYELKSIEVMCVNNLGMFNWNKGNYEEALKFFFQSLEMNDEFGTEKSSSIYLNNIGLIYQEMKQYEKSLDYHKKALEIRQQYNLKRDQVTSLINIGINQKNLGRIDDAILTYKNAIALAEQTNNLIDFYRLLDNLGTAYQLKGETQKAINCYLKALDKPDDFEGLERDEISIYNNLTSIYNKLGKPNEAIEFADKGFELVERYPDLEKTGVELFLHAAESYYMLRKFELARSLTEKFVSVKDSIFSEQSAKAVADLEVKYDTQKKEREILVQRAEIAEQRLKLQRRNYQLYGFVLFSVVLGLIGYMFYRQQRLQNIQLIKENQLRDALVQIETQNQLQEQRLRISRDLHDNIGAQLTFVISSLDNLKFGNKLPKQTSERISQISDFTTSTIHELRDTIWAMNKDDISIEDLLTRLSNYIEKANLAEKNTRFKMDFNRELDQQQKFSSLKGMSVYRMIQEALNNAIKYAEADQIELKVESTYNQFLFSIIDNGIGFDKDTVTMGNGLLNFKKRSNEIGGHIDIISSEGEGTRVNLIVPKNT